MYTDPYYLAFIRTNQWMHAVEMQANRIIGPTIDPNIVGMIKYRLDWNQRQRDLDFFLIALNRLRIAVVSLNKKIKDREISNSLKEFNKDIPDIKDLRDIGEHFDEYDLSQGNLNKKNYSPTKHPIWVGEKKMLV